MSQRVETKTMVPGGADDRTAPLSQSKVFQPDEAPRRSPDDVVDRYVIIDRLASGNMGAVYVAYDSELARRVALKLLLPPRRSEDFEARFRREAQAIAQLSHPNVVAVYDVGTIGTEMYVAMELVTGRSLLEWMREPPHPLDEVLSVFVQAGRGLAAAHGRGLVHRDFKPANVLLGDDGRVRVADFGLARYPDQSPPEEPLPATGVLADSITRTGTLMGTPRYMAPEQHAAGPIDARADQFAFCVCMYEALVRRRPFEGKDYKDLAANVRAGRVRAIADASIPEWLRALIMRGMRPQPEDRFPSMDALLAELTLDRRVARESALDGSSSTEPMFAAFPPRDRGPEAAALARLRGRLEEVWRLKANGEYASAIAAAEGVAAQAHQVAYLPLRAAALYTLGNLQHRTGRSDSARETLYLAAQVAASAADDWQVANVWVFLVGVLGALTRHDEARAIARVADAAINRVGDNPSLRSRLYNNRGRALLAEGLHDEAAREFGLAVALDERTHGPEHPFLVISLVSLAESLLETGHATASRPHLERALDICQRIAAQADVRPRPSHARCLQALARVHRCEGEPARASALLEQAKDIWAQVPGAQLQLDATLAQLADLHQGD